MIINILKIMDQSCDKIGDSTQTYFICLMSEPVDNSVSDYKDFIHWIMREKISLWRQQAMCQWWNVILSR